MILYQPSLASAQNPLWTLYQFEGQDAASFLNRLTTAKNLDVLTGSAAFFLTPLGKIRAAFVLWRQAPDSFLIELYGTQTQAFCDLIDQFHFGEKISLKQLPFFLSCYLKDDLDTASSQFQMTKNEPDFFELQIPKHPHFLPMTRLWTKTPFPSDTATLISEEEFQQKRIQAFQSLAPQEFNEERNPLDLGCRFLFETPKGCYPGQEVIEKIHSRAEPTHRLIQFTSELAKTGDTLFLGSTPIGTVTSYQKPFGLALISKIAAQKVLQKTDQLTLQSSSLDDLKNLESLEILGVAAW